MLIASCGTKPKGELDCIMLVCKGAEIPVSTSCIDFSNSKRYPKNGEILTMGLSK